MQVSHSFLTIFQTIFWIQTLTPPVCIEEPSSDFRIALCCHVHTHYLRCDQRRLFDNFDGFYVLCVYAIRQIPNPMRRDMTSIKTFPYSERRCSHIQTRYISSSQVQPFFRELPSFPSAHGWSVPWGAEFSSLAPLPPVRAPLRESLGARAMHTHAHMCTRTCTPPNQAKLQPQNLGLRHTFAHFPSLVLQPRHPYVLAEPPFRVSF